MKDFEQLNPKLVRSIVYRVYPPFFTYVLAHNKEGKKVKWLEQDARGLIYNELTDNTSNKWKTTKISNKFIQKLEVTKKQDHIVSIAHVITVGYSDEITIFENSELNVFWDKVSDFLNKRKKDLIIEVLKTLFTELGIDRFNVYGSKYWEWYGTSRWN